MELSLSSTSCIPLRSKLKHKHALFDSQFPTSTASTKTRKTKPLFIVNASRPTLSSNWLVSPQDFSASTASPWLPRVEDLDTTNMLLRQRIIFLGSQVDDMTADFIISQLLLLDAEDSKKDIKLFINSPGGSVTAGMGIYDAMKLCKADVSTVCLGLAASMGAFILASGTKGKRYCMPNSRVMIHQPLGTAGGKIDLDTDRDNFMNPWEAKEYGLVDGVIDDGKPGLVAPVVDATPPPKTRVWDLWKVEGSRKAKKNLPSEHKLLQKASKGSDGDKGSGKEGEAPIAV
ncbi:ATP-dependent Clp protease proteolytic subunit 3, chloroplastic isoform X2 [Vigna radiata var. radiata]|uniref:ATP-dependent Clp protease proteolytic subunit n=1 Tax=Vigna radiata var. radiata TaxID=3916 RepID=A0A3Q0EXE0_VIGRR|nr:ATP-dependent Clp protease proteolytic subunit 3, chloroplastic isoform X2 [Vigna radiata var. radiata]